MGADRAVENLIYTYAMLIDQADFHNLALLFRNATIRPSDGSSHTTGYDDVLALYSSGCKVYPDTGTLKTRHVTTNVIIHVDGDTASSDSVFTVFQATESFPLQPIISGRYKDSFSCSEGVWAFSVREIAVDFIGDCSHHLTYDTEVLRK